MNYTILKNTEEEFFVEIERNTFRTKIIFDFIPEEDFKGIAICCSYNFQGKAIGFLKDNGLIVHKIDGKPNRPIFHIDDTIIQAGPTLIENFEPVRNFQTEGFSTHDILSGPHAHIGQKKFGNYILGFTKSCTLSEITKKYQDYNIQNAIKLPGLKQVGLYFKSSHQTVSFGNLPMTAALCFESKFKDVSLN
jgi:hypothetical protein